MAYYIKFWFLICTIFAIVTLSDLTTSNLTSSVKFRWLRIFEGKIFTGSVLETKVGYTKDHCAILCKRNIECVSVNAKDLTDGKYTCQLMNETARSGLTTDAASTYYGKTYLGHFHHV